MGVLTLSVCDEGSMTVGRAVSTFEVLAGLVEVVDVWTCWSSSIDKEAMAPGPPTDMGVPMGVSLKKYEIWINRNNWKKNWTLVF